MRYIFFTMIVLSSSNAYALTCGTNLVTSIDITADGRVFYTDAGPVSSGLLCNVVTTFSGVAPGTCKTWVSMAMSAMMSGKYIHYSTYGPTCSVSWTDMDVNEFILKI